MAYAIIKTGGKQFRVEEGARLRVPALDKEAGVIKVNLMSSWCTPAGYVRSAYMTGEVDHRRAIWLRCSEARNASMLRLAMLSWCPSRTRFPAGASRRAM